MTEFRMPSLGADMEAGTLVEWKVKPGDAVKRGDLVAVVDTNKGAIDIEIWEDGVVAEVRVPVGTKVPVGTVLALLRGEGEAAAPSTGPPPERIELSGATLVSAPLTRPSGAMHEVTAPSVVSEVRVGLGPSALNLRLAGRVAWLVSTRAITLAVIVSVPAPRRLVVDTSWDPEAPAETAVDLSIPFESLGAIPGSDLSFGIQLLDESGRVLESIPVGRWWTVAVPAGTH